tara:strand:+ start:485 stop:706 length:222 start_codon:yes stop_codon:yes gene_type:complete
MNALANFLGLAASIAALVGICWLALRAAVLARGKDYTHEDDQRVQDILDATHPAPLEPERPRVKAGSAWGAPQ